MSIFKIKACVLGQGQVLKCYSFLALISSAVCVDNCDVRNRRWVNPNGPDLVTVLPNLPAGMSGEERRGEDTQILSFLNKTRGHAAAPACRPCRCCFGAFAEPWLWQFYLFATSTQRLCLLWQSKPATFQFGNAGLSEYPCQKINRCYITNQSLLNFIF